MLSLAAMSSKAHMVSTAACGWFGARHALAGPMLLRMAVCSFFWLGTAKQYGIGGMPPPPGPPVPHDCDCQATSVPSFLAPTFTRAYADGRAPATRSSESRSSIRRTGAPPAFFESVAVTIPQRSGPHLLPHPPPT